MERIEKINAMLENGKITPDQARLLKNALEASREKKVPEHDEHVGHGMPDDADSDEPVAVGGHDIYTCPMSSHYHVLQYGAGACSECGMTLVPLAETDNEKVYVCPMSECGTVQDHRGTCPVCGMNLVRYQPGDEND